MPVFERVALVVLYADSESALVCAEDRTSWNLSAYIQNLMLFRSQNQGNKRHHTQCKCKCPKLCLQALFRQQIWRQTVQSSNLFSDQHYQKWYNHSNRKAPEKSSSSSLIIDECPGSYSNQELPTRDGMGQISTTSSSNLVEDKQCDDETEKAAKAFDMRI